MNKMRIFVIIIIILFLGESAQLIYFANRSQMLQKKLDALKPGYERLSQKEQEATSKYAEGSNKISALQKELDAVKEDRNNLLAQAKNLLTDRGRLKDVEASLEKATQDIQDLTQEKEGMQSESLQLKEQIKNLEDAGNKLSKERDDIKAAYEKDKKQDTIKALKKQAADSQKEKEKLDKSISIKENQIEVLKKEKANMEATKALMAQMLNDYKKDIATAAQKNKSLEKTINELPNRFASLGRQNKMLIRETAMMHYNLGVFYTKNKEYSRAAGEFEKAIEINPNDAYSHFNLGYIYAEYMVSRKKAIEQFRQYLRLVKSDDKDADWVKKYILTWDTYEGKEPVQ
jgi:chromosome segregation ATPase